MPSLKSETRVVNIKSGEPYDVYIGRAVPRKGIKASVWGNPFKEGMDPFEAMRILQSVHREGHFEIHFEGKLTREKAVECYRLWFTQCPELVARARRELKGKVLACWCSPRECHGDVLVQIVEGNA